MMIAVQLHIMGYAQRMMAAGEIARTFRAAPKEQTRQGGISQAKGPLPDAALERIPRRGRRNHPRGNFRRKAGGNSQVQRTERWGTREWELNALVLLYASALSFFGVLGKIGAGRCSEQAKEDGGHAL